MKLLYCSNCGSVFNLTLNEKKCVCGLTSGQYLDKTNAVYNGNFAVPLGIDNRSFIYARTNMGSNFTAFTINENCTTFKKNDIDKTKKQIEKISKYILDGAMVFDSNFHQVDNICYFDGIVYAYYGTSIEKVDISDIKNWKIVFPNEMQPLSDYLTENA